MLKTQKPSITTSHVLVIFNFKNLNFDIHFFKFSYSVLSTVTKPLCSFFGTYQSLRSSTQLG